MTIENKKTAGLVALIVALTPIVVTVIDRLTGEPTLWNRSIQISGPTVVNIQL